jgi:hypothetical protein
MSVMVCLLPWIENTRPAGVVFLLIISLPLAILSIHTSIRVSAVITVNDSGIRQTFPFGNVIELQWPNVVSVIERSVSQTFQIVGRNGTKMTFNNQIVGFDELLTIIQGSVDEAVLCRHAASDRGIPATFSLPAEFKPPRSAAIFMSVVLSVISLMSLSWLVMSWINGEQMLPPLVLCSMAAFFVAFFYLQRRTVIIDEESLTAKVGRRELKIPFSEIIDVQVSSNSIVHQGAPHVLPTVLVAYGDDQLYQAGTFEGGVLKLATVLRHAVNLYRDRHGLPPLPESGNGHY